MERRSSCEARRVWLSRSSPIRNTSTFSADRSSRRSRPRVRARQHLLWASTGTKNPAYSDVLYVEPLIGPETINTLPDATLEAYRDHGHAAPTLEHDLDRARHVFAELGRRGIHMGEVGDALQTEGVRLFQDSFDRLLELMEA